MPIFFWEIVLGMSAPAPIMQYNFRDVHLPVVYEKCRETYKTACSKEYEVFVLALSPLGSLLPSCLGMVAQVSKVTCAAQSATEERKGDQRRETKMSGKQALVMSETSGKMKGRHSCRGTVDEEKPGMGTVNPSVLWQ